MNIFLLICQETQNPSDFFESENEWLELLAGLWEEEQFLALIVKKEKETSLLQKLLGNMA